MKNFILFFATVFCALTAKAQVTAVVDTVPGTIDTSSLNLIANFDVSPDSTGLYYIQRSLNASFTNPVNGTPALIASVVDTFTEQQLQLVSNTNYWFRLVTQTPTNGLQYGNAIQVRTLTAYYLPSITVDSTVRLDSAHIAVYYRCTTGNDTARVRAVTASDQNFLFTLNPTPSQFRTAGQTSGVLTITVPTNGSYYVKVDITNRKGTRPQNPLTWTVAPFNYGSQQIIVSPVITTATATETSISWYGTATNADTTYWLINTDSAMLTGSLPQGIGGIQHLLPTSSNSLTINVSAGDQWYAVLVGVKNGIAYFSSVYGKASDAIPAATLVVTVPQATVDTNSATAVLVVNTNGHTGTLIAFIGHPTVAYNTTSWVVGNGTYANTSIQIPLTNLLSGTIYQLQVVDVASGDTVGVSNVATFSTDNNIPPVTSAASFAVTAIQDQVWTSNDYYSRVQFQYVSQNLPATVSLKISNDYDTTFTDVPYIISLPGTLMTLDATAVYDHIDVLASSLNPAWDQYSIIPGRWVAQLIGANDDNTSLAKSNLYYFFPRGIQTGIRELTSRNAMFVNGTQMVFIGDEGGDVSIYDLSGVKVLSQKVLPGEHIFLDKHGFYIYHMTSITGKTVKGKIFLN